MQPTPETLAQTYSDKSDAELSFLHARGTLTQMAYEVLEQELERRGIPVPPRPDVGQLEREAQGAHARVTLAGHWKGRAPLASAYWLVGTLGFWIMYFVVLLIREYLPSAMPLAWMAMIAFLIFAWVSIWRCWRNTSWPGWGHLARLQVVGSVILVLVFATVLISNTLQPQSVVR